MLLCIFISISDRLFQKCLSISVTMDSIWRPQNSIILGFPQNIHSSPIFNVANGTDTDNETCIKLWVIPLANKIASISVIVTMMVQGTHYYGFNMISLWIRCISIYWYWYRLPMASRSLFSFDAMLRCVCMRFKEMTEFKNQEHISCLQFPLYLF